MKLGSILGLALILGLFGLVILVVLWPGRKHGVRLLRRWGVPDPSEVDVETAVRYLKRRRFWYPWLFFVLPLLSEAVGASGDDDSWTVAWTVLLGGMLGELLAWRRPGRGRREAMLAYRGVTDLVPVWALVLLALAIAGGVVRAILTHVWPQLGVTLGCAAVAAVVVALALRRPVAGDAAVDLVLRARSARVATGLAIILPAALPQPVLSFGAVLVFVLSVAAGIAVVTPDPHLAATLT
ncbi:hypothetical protein LWP59_21950 [Amycolatopsis acidiphila]|uniref:Uncharacterized protein n=1 Tax=Amycolatopsis acidiphila TaxID=715473 RepID=A0A557ZSS4_9PSEU|nr:hypothetical protein [Amycolatopsis acidiphila]TVT15064.1 hypothetical protein FNH06_36770 [Amycolatopsis acidiphila]UIJ56835.1 hypothetical protein LWP59_21950 [Amycolatopsis acidiphila]GHG54867.1 hypothetical protein GCM10017788_04920 [Amycolatopsis acidiphila]